MLYLQTSIQSKKTNIVNQSLCLEFTLLYHVSSQPLLPFNKSKVKTPSSVTSPSALFQTVLLFGWSQLSH